MIFDRKKFYKDFLNSKEGMATNILSDRLKRLEAVGVISSKVFEEKKTMKEYSLTQKGKDLIPVLLETIAWSAKYHDNLAVPPNFLKEMEKDRNKIITRIQEGLE